jgi:hypothetical protein
VKRTALACCCVAALAALAAPLPKGGKGGFEAKGWKKADADKDCELAFDAKAKSVTFKLPRGRRMEWAWYRQTAPRLTRPAGDGDFDVQVRARVAPYSPARGEALSAKLIVEGPDPVEAGGHGGVACFSVGLGHADQGRGAEALASVGISGMNMTSGGGIRPAPYRKVKAGGKELWEVYLKVERRGDRLTPYASADGKKWAAPEREVKFGGLRRLPFPGELRVGVAVVGRTTRAAEVTFDQFKLTPVKARKKAKD